MSQVFNNIPWIVPKEFNDIKKIYQQLGKIIYIKKNTILKFPGEENKLFYIKKGVCFAHVNTADDKLVTIGVLLPGRSIGDMTVIAGEKVNMTIVAQRNSQILVIPPSDFKKIILSDSNLLLQITKTILAKRNCHMEGLIANLTLPIEERLKLFFIATIEDKEIAIESNFIELPLKLNNEELATITSSTRVSVSRIISNWIKHNMIIKKGSTLYVNPILLKNIKTWSEI